MSNTQKLPTPDPTPDAKEGVSGGRGVPKDSRSRPHVKVRLSAADTDTARQIDEWKQQRQAAPNLAQAVRLFNAARRGDLDTVLEIIPWLPAALGATGKKRSRQSDPPSDPSFQNKTLTDRRGKTANAELVAAIAEITLCDPVVNQRAVQSLAMRLESAGYSAQDVREWHTRCWLLGDWRGKKGERPGLKDLQLAIGQVRALPPLPVRPPAPVPAHSADTSVSPQPAGTHEPPTRGEPVQPAPRAESSAARDQQEPDPYFRQRDVADDPASPEDRPTQGPGEVVDSPALPDTGADHLQVAPFAADAFPETEALPADNLPRALAPIQIGSLEVRSQEDYQLLAYSVSAACGCDFAVDASALKTVDQLYQAGYCAEDVAWFLKDDWPHIWPGTRGEPPTLKALQEHIGHAKHLVGLGTRVSQSSGGKDVSIGDELLRRVDLLRKHLSGEAPLDSPDDLLPEYTGPASCSPYLAHPRFARQAQNAEAAEWQGKLQEAADYERLNCATCNRARAACKCGSVTAIPGRVKDFWMTTLWQFQAQLNRVTYDNWVRPIDLVSFDGQRLLVEVPNSYIQDWLQKHLLDTLTRTFNEFMIRLDPLHPCEKHLALEIQVAPGPVFGGGLADGAFG